MVSNKEITEFIADKIIASQNVTDFCQNNFGNDITVFIGVDENSPPDVKSLPAFIIEPTVKNIGDNETNFDCEIVMHIGILGDEKPIVDGRKITYNGTYKIEEIGNIIVDLIKKEFSTSTNMDTFDVSFYQDAITAFPTYSGVVVANFSVPNTIGNDKIEFNC